jgi:hypothetical protein
MGRGGTEAAADYVFFQYKWECYHHLGAGFSVRE